VTVQLTAVVGVQLKVQLPEVNAQLVGNPTGVPEKETVPMAAVRYETSTLETTTVQLSSVPAMIGVTQVRVVVVSV